MKSTLTPKAHKQKMNTARSQQKGLETTNTFNKKFESPKLREAREKLKATQSKNK